MTKEEIIQKWIYNTPFIPLKEAVEKAMDEYLSQISSTKNENIKAFLDNFIQNCESSVNLDSIQTAYFKTWAEGLRVNGLSYTQFDIESLIKRNYAAQVRRGKDLSDEGCTYQIAQEYSEYLEARLYKSEEEQKLELSDIVLSCLTSAESRGWDLLSIMSEKVAYNETRND